MQKYKMMNGNVIEIGMQNLTNMTVPVKIDGKEIHINIKEDSGDFGFYLDGEFVYFRDV